MKMDAFREKLMKFAAALNNNVILQIIRDAMLAYMPITISTGLFLILANFPIPGVIDWVCKVFNCDFFTFFLTITQLYRVGLGIGGFLVLITASISAANKFGANLTQAVVTAVVSFLVLIPLGDGFTIRQADLSANNMFMALVVAITSVWFFKFLSDKNIKIRMPKSVPDMVSKPIESLIPSFLVMMSFWAIRLICGAFGTTFANVIVTVLSTPMKYVTGNIFGVIFTQIFSSLLWFFGIHGGSITTAFVSPVYAMLSEENRAAAMAGLPIPNIISTEFGNFGGIGVIGAVTAALLVAKSKRYREVAKVTGVPCLFGVGEPLLFGFPLLMNFTFFIPFVFGNAISSIIAYIAMKIGLVPIPNGLVSPAWTTPILIKGFLTVQSISGTLLELVQLVVITLLWIPFIRIADKQVCEQEAQAEAAGDNDDDE